MSLLQLVGQLAEGWPLVGRRAGELLHAAPATAPPLRPRYRSRSAFRSASVVRGCERRASNSRAERVDGRSARTVRVLQCQVLSGVAVQFRVMHVHERQAHA